MPETRLIINGPEVKNTGPTKYRSVDFDSENKSLETDSRNRHEDMGFYF